jgi:hypothetical protein
VQFKKKLEEEQAETQKVLEEHKRLLEEEKDQERRRNNIIIYRVKESSETEANERAHYDRKFVIDLLNKGLQLTATNDDVKKVIRIGKKEADRPLLVEFRAHIIKNQVLESLKQLREAEDRFKNISIAPDMTKSERAQCKEAVKEAKEKKSADLSGEYKYVVRGLPGRMVVVKLKQKS